MGRFVAKLSQLVSSRAGKGSGSRWILILRPENLQRHQVSNLLDAPLPASFPAQIIAMVPSPELCGFRP